MTVNVYRNRLVGVAPCRRLQSRIRWYWLLRQLGAVAFCNRWHAEKAFVISYVIKVADHRNFAGIKSWERVFKKKIVRPTRQSKVVHERSNRTQMAYKASCCISTYRFVSHFPISGGPRRARARSGPTSVNSQKEKNWGTPCDVPLENCRNTKFNITYYLIRFTPIMTRVFTLDEVCKSSLHSLSEQVCLVAPLPMCLPHTSHIFRCLSMPQPRWCWHNKNLRWRQRIRRAPCNERILPVQSFPSVCLISGLLDSHRIQSLWRYFLCFSASRSW